LSNKLTYLLTYIDNRMCIDQRSRTDPFFCALFVDVSASVRDARGAGRRDGGRGRSRHGRDALSQAAPVGRAAAAGADGVLTVEGDAARRTGRRRVAAGERAIHRRRGLVVERHH